ncbi:MAG: hypothetical protein PHT07_17785 [Paludibacter sp.]|nr:hypothetical protein [Paludibacter sp.]
MKKSSILIFILTLVFTGTGNASNENERKKFEYEFNIILADLDSVITNSKSQQATVVKNYNFVKNKILNKELPIAFDSTLNYNFFGCASFGIKEKDPQKGVMSFGRFIVDHYKKYPALAYAVIINTFQSAYDYYNNRDLFLISDNNLIEKTYFETDAISLEAMFLNTYMKDSPQLGVLEKYLIADLPNGMDGSVILFYTTDLQLLHTMDNIRSEGKSESKLLKKFSSMGKDLLQTVTFKSDSKWENYCSIIKLKTYVYYSQQVIFDIVHLKSGVTQAAFKLENYPDNLETIKQVQKVIRDHNDDLNYHQETLDILGDTYKK